MASIQFKRGTREQLDAAATANGLKLGEPYLVTDEDVIAIGTGVSTYVNIGGDSDIPTPINQDDKVLTSDGADLIWRYPQEQNTTIIQRQLMGSPIIADTMDFLSTTGVTSLVDQQLTFQAIYIPFPMFVTGVILRLVTAGAFTGDNENAIALYSYDSAMLTKIATTANDENIWKTSAYSQQPFVSPATLSKGLYFIGFLYNNSAQTTAPTLRALEEKGGVAMLPLLGETGNMQFSRAKAGQTSLPSSIGANNTELNLSNNQLYYMGLY